MKNVIILIFCIVLFSCSTVPQVIKVPFKKKQIKREYVTLSERKLKCINQFLMKDIDIIKANTVCESIYTRK